MSEEVILNDNESLNKIDCEHRFIKQADIKIEGIIWDIYYCSKCLVHARKERPCPLNLKEIDS